MVTVRSTHILSRFRARVADLKSTAPDPENELGQQMYPRRHFFEQASAVMAAAGRSVPVFIDKYLAPSWEDAKWMYDRAQELEIPFMAGSSVPICFWRNTAEGEGCKPKDIHYRRASAHKPALRADPAAEHPIGVELESALMLSYGHLEAYGYHGLEALAAQVERRGDGVERGIAAVQCLSGDAVWAAAEEGVWSVRLALAALDLVDKNDDEGYAAAAQAAGTTGGLELLKAGAGEGSSVFLIEFADGFRAALLHAQGGFVSSW